jgi:hypothetical protein
VPTGRPATGLHLASDLAVAGLLLDADIAEPALAAEAGQRRMGSRLSLVDRWRAEASTLRRRGAEAQAAALESCAEELEEEDRLLSLEAITLEDAERESGYSYSALQKMVSRGRIPNAGTAHRPRVRRSDLPKKPRPPSSGSGDPDLAGLVLAPNDESPPIP